MAYTNCKGCGKPTTNEYGYCPDCKFGGKNYEAKRKGEVMQNV